MCNLYYSIHELIFENKYFGKKWKTRQKKRVSQIKTTRHILNQGLNCFDFKDVYVHFLTLHTRRIQYSISSELKSQHNDTEYSYEKQHKNERGMNIYLYFLILSNVSDSEKNWFQIKRTISNAKRCWKK